MKAYQIEACRLFGARTCSAKNYVRNYLNGVLLSAERGTVVATDGHKLFIGYLDTKQPDFPDVIIPAETIDKLGKLASKKLREGTSPVFVRLYGPHETQNAPCTLRLSLEAEEIWTAPVDGKFPDYERVIPSEVSGETAQFNAELLLCCQRALALYSGAAKINPFLQHNGTGPGVMSSAYTPAIVVVMPWRCDNPNSDWAPKLAEVTQCAA